MLCLQSFTYFSSYPAVPLRLGGWAYRGSWEEGETVGLPQVFCPAASPLSAWVAEDMEMLVGSLLTLPPPVPPHTVPSLTSSSRLGNEDLFTRGTSTLENPKKAMCCVSRKSVTYIILCVTLWKCRSRYWNGKTIVKRNWSIREITPNLILLGFTSRTRVISKRQNLALILPLSLTHTHTHTLLTSCPTIVAKSKETHIPRPPPPTVKAGEEVDFVLLSVFSALPLWLLGGVISLVQLLTGLPGDYLNPISFMKSGKANLLSQNPWNWWCLFILSSHGKYAAILRSWRSNETY